MVSASIRGLLLEPSEANWQLLLEEFAQVPAGEREVTVSYAQGHLEDWPDELKRMTNKENTLPEEFFSLGRIVNLHGEDSLRLFSPYLAGCEHLSLTGIFPYDKNPQLSFIEDVPLESIAIKRWWLSEERFYAFLENPAREYLKEITLFRSLEAVCGEKNYGYLKEGIISALGKLPNLRTLKLGCLNDNNVEELLETDFSLEELSFTYDGIESNERVCEVYPSTDIHIIAY